MIESLIEIEPIETEERLYEVKEKCIADVEEEVIPIDLCARISSHPVHLSIVFMEKVFRSIPFDPEEFFTSLAELRIPCECMEFIRCVLLYFIFGSEFSQHCLLIQDLIRDTDTSECIRFLPFESHVLFFSEESIPIRIITDHVDESKTFLHEDEEDGEALQLLDELRRESRLSDEEDREDLMKGRLFYDDTIFLDDEVLIRESEIPKLVRVYDDDLLLEEVWTGKHREEKNRK